MRSNFPYILFSMHFIEPSPAEWDAMFKEILGEPAQVAPKKKRSKPKPKKPVSPPSPPPPILFPKSTVAEYTLVTPPPIPIPIEPRSTLADPKGYVLEMYDRYIEPKIVADNPLTQHMKRDIYRRAVGEIAAGELTNVGAVGFLTAEDILNLTILSVRKAGIII